MKKSYYVFEIIATLLLLAGVVVSCTDDGTDAVSQFTSFQASPEEMKLNCGETAQISVSTAPEYTFAEGELTYTIFSATPEGCVSVSKTGLVTAVDELVGGNGTAMILVNTIDGANPRYIDVVVYESKNLRIDSDDLIVTKLSALSQLYAIVGGFSGEAYSVDWTSSDADVINIEPYSANTQYGVITIKESGVTTITATLLDETTAATEYTDEISIKVLDVVVSIESHPTTMSTGANYTFESVVEVDGSVDDSMNVEWYLSDANGIAVDSSSTGSTITTDGVFTPGDSQGDVYVSVGVIGFSGITPSATSEAITIYVPVTVKINEANPIVYTSTSEDNYTFTTTLSPTNGNIYDDAVVVWSLEDNSVDATITQDGLVTVGKDGSGECNSGDVTVVATIYTDDTRTTVESTDSTTLTFDPQPVVGVESVTITNGDLSMSYGEVVTLSVSILPEGAINQSVDWAIVSGDDVITMSGSTVTVIGTGTAVVKVTSKDKSYNYPSDTITISVGGVSIPSLGDGGDL